MKRPRRTFLRTLLLTAALFSTATAARAATLFDQLPMLYSTNYQRGVNWQSKGGLPRTGTGEAPTPNQFRGGIVYGAVTYQKSTALNASLNFAANAKNLNYPHTENANGTVRLVLRAQSGAPYMIRSISFLFGSAIAPPPTKEDGTALTGNELTSYWAAEPATLNNHANTGYYWSPHANQVYAIQPGRVDITWRRLGPEASEPTSNLSLYTNVGGSFFRLFSTNYLVSGATFKSPRKIFWTEKSFQGIGKAILVPTARVGAVNIVYQNEFPERVTEEFQALGQSEIVTAATNRLQELRTLWFERTDSQIHAYNKEGRVFVELLGDVRSGTTRNQLGYEIVDVIRQALPADVTIDLGEKLTPPGTAGSSDPLFPEPILADPTKNFTYRHGLLGSDLATYYATRETKNLNDYQMYWMEESVAGLHWPLVLARYQLIWPSDPARYSHYVRPASDQETAKLTAVPMPTANVPFIDWQDRDGLDNPRAFLTEDFKFYTYLDAVFPAHRTLLRFNAGENVAFERVFSVLETVVKTPGFDGSRERAINLTEFTGPGVNGALDLNPALGNPYGQMPSGVYFDGGEFTIEAWVYVRSHRNYARLIDFGDGTLGQHVALALSSATTGKPVLAVTSSQVTAANALPLNQWVHLAAVFTPTNATVGTGSIYINGALVGSGSVFRPNAVTRPSNLVGRSNFGDENPDAQFDNLRIWSVARTSAQLGEGMTNLYPAGTAGLLAQYQFSDEDGSTGANSNVALDSSGNGRTMTLFNTTILPDKLARPRFVEATAWVGQRLAPPAGESTKTTDLSYLAGSVNQTYGTGFSVTAYQDPFAVGFAAAAKGSIIPVNAGNNTARLEVWWHRRNALDLAKGFQPIYWPSVIGRYSIQWPTNAPHSREIILASNDGSGALTSLEAKGSIYFQNDPATAGYNPNEEHALMLGGQAYALRDDLNVTSTAGYSSHPYVLVEFSDSDGRPSASVFQVLREKEEIKFDYAMNAGTVLQPPMPLPFLEKPLVPTEIGSPPKSLNVEIQAWTTTASSAVEGNSISHVQVTTGARHFFKSYERLALQNIPASGAITTRWILATNVNTTDKTVSGVVSDKLPLSLGTYTGTQPGALKYRYALANLADVTVNQTVMVVGQAAATNWLATVSAKDATAGYVEVQFTGSLPGAANQADLLVLPLAGLAASNPFTNWRLAYGKVPEAITDPVLRQRYASLTLQDRKRDVWVYRGPHDGSDNSRIAMQFYYKTLTGFDYPGAAVQPPVGTITPYLRPRNADGTFAGDPIQGNANNDSVGDGNPLGIFYRSVWPEGTPVLQMAESLTLPKRGLPAIRGQRSLEIFYQQSQSGSGETHRSAILHDPTREKVFLLGPKESTTTLGQIPSSVKTSVVRGKTYFPNLPPHLSERFFLDPNRGSNGALVFLGQFVDEPVGDHYLLLNIVGQKDAIDLKGLCAADDERKARWDSVITDGLQTVMERFVENPAKLGTFIPAASPETIGPSALAEVKDDDVAVDSYALTAIGPGTGYLTLLAGNGLNTGVQPAEEPVAVQILRVVDKLYLGEVKIVKSSNPLAEKLTLQQVVDLAGKVNDYEFEWKITSPVDGQPPAVYQNTARTLVGDGVWNHIRFPLTTDTPGAVSASATPSTRRAAEVNGSAVTISRIPFQSVSTIDGQLYFQLPAGSPTPVNGNEVVVRYGDGTELNATVVPTPAGQASSTIVAAIDAGQALASGQARIIDLYERAVDSQPQSIVFREFTVTSATAYSQYYLSLNLDGALGARVYVNGSLAVTANLAAGNTTTVTAPSGFSALPKVYRLGPEVFAGGTTLNDQRTHRLAVELFSTARPDAVQTFNLRLEAYEAVDLASGANSPWLPLASAQYQDKVRAILGENADVRALSDNYLISRYRPTNSSHASYRSDVNGVKQGWSQWTEPQLAEGWIKRVLAGINPFNQRVTDLFNNRVNTDVSILTQAGARYEGDVALNLDTINNAGLIEIYETVLKRGKMLSVGAGINFGPANDALLLAAGYLNDLYLMLGNEAWADAANPTIGIGTKDKTYGDISTALFAFKGQMASLLEEELALLRGRDDFLVPGVTTRPVYNRLFWNYTRGIDSGEVIYALNYNIQENNDTGVDGVINADDARKMFPQGHGDAYGHYLTALKGYYALLMDTDFDWVPRIEAVTVLGKPVSVDYQDERKFAAAAAAVARSGRQIFDLTWRKDFVPGDDAGWKYFATNRVNTTRSQPVPRYWGLDHWATRTGQGAYLNWAVGNSILPEVDSDPTHEGIQKVDRTTVPELKELPATADDLQTALDNAEAHLTPLGLASGSLAFDIDPTQVTGPNIQTHFEQVYGRAKVALNNALAAFDDAKDVTRLLRSEQDSLADSQAGVAKQELAYTNELIELYGTPYADDIGTGKTYVQGFEGPDLLHYMYVDDVTLYEKSTGLWAPNDEDTFVIDIQGLAPDWGSTLGIHNWLVPAKIKGSNGTEIDNPAYKEGEHFISYNWGPHGFLDKPANWTGKRKSPGKIQQAISEIIAAHDNLYVAITAYAMSDAEDLFKAVALFESRGVSLNAIRGLETSIRNTENEGTRQANNAAIVSRDLEVAAGIADDIAQVTGEFFPKNLIFGLAAGGDTFAPGRGLIILAGKTIKNLLFSADAIQNRIWLKADTERQKALLDLQKQIDELGRIEEFKQGVVELGAATKQVQGDFILINQALRRLDDASRQYQGLVATGDRIQTERLVFRQRAAAVTQGFRTRDAAFRIFRTEKLERYKTLFDLAARYAFLAANAYDYETGLLHKQQGKEFINRIVNSRALGVMRNGEPQYAGSNTGDPGLSSALAEMKTDFDVLKGRLGFNNPNSYATTVSLRMEKERIIPVADGHATWQDVLEHGRKANLLDDDDVRRNCMQIDRGDGLPVPGIVLEFSTTIEDGANLFGRTLAGGDHYFDTSLFATKIFGVGVAFEGYVGMDNPVANSSAVNAAGGFSPPDPTTTYLGSKSLAATPGIYLIPVGVDSMRSPPLGDASQIRSWRVNDVAIPLPFNIGGSDFSTKALWQSSESLTEPLFAVRKHQAFRPVSTTAAFSSSIYGGFGNLQLSQFTNNRLIGRSVWNSKWKLVIPGHKLLNNPNEGLDRFIQTVKDVKLHFVTYSYAGN
ncbi:MAG: LamG domain-containing protein [Verrucomicrobia bacterium]|nr:LamG domain-containing protein [Verrucomicrobiota bacterium]